MKARLVISTRLILVLLALFVTWGVSAKSKKRQTPKSVVITQETMREREYKMIPLGQVSYETVDAVCRPWLTEKGVLVHEKRRASILVNDFPEVIAKIEKFIRDVDREAVNIRIDVDYVGSGKSVDDKIDVRTGTGKGGRRSAVVIDNGKLRAPKSIHISPSFKRGESSRRTSSFIVTRDGQPASIWVGKTIVDPSWLNNVVINPTVIISGGGAPVIIEGTDVDMKWADVGVSLQVRPTYHENSDTISVEVYPMVSYIDGKGKKQAVNVETVSTNVTVKNGRRISIGGLISGKKEQYIKLFGPDFFRKTDFSNVLDMYLTATTMSPSGRFIKNR